MLGSLDVNFCGQGLRAEFSWLLLRFPPAKGIGCMVDSLEGVCLKV